MAYHRQQETSSRRSNQSNWLEKQASRIAEARPSSSTSSRQAENDDRRKMRGQNCRRNQADRYRSPENMNDQSNEDNHRNSRSNRLDNRKTNRRSQQVHKTDSVGKKSRSRSRSRSRSLNGGNRYADRDNRSGIRGSRNRNHNEEKSILISRLPQHRQSQSSEHCKTSVLEKENGSKNETAADKGAESKIGGTQETNANVDFCENDSKQMEIDDSETFLNQDSFMVIDEASDGDDDLDHDIVQNDVTKVQDAVQDELLKEDVVQDGVANEDEVQDEESKEDVVQDKLAKEDAISDEVAKEVSETPQEEEPQKLDTAQIEMVSIPENVPTDQGIPITKKDPAPRIPTGYRRMCVRLVKLTALEVKFSKHKKFCKFLAASPRVHLERLPDEIVSAIRRRDDGDPNEEIESKMGSNEQKSVIDSGEAISIGEESRSELSIGKGSTDTDGKSISILKSMLISKLKSKKTLKKKLQKDSANSPFLNIPGMPPANALWNFKIKKKSPPPSPTSKIETTLQNVVHPTTAAKEVKVPKSVKKPSALILPFPMEYSSPLMRLETETARKQQHEEQKRFEKRRPQWQRNSRFPKFGQDQESTSLDSRVSTTVSSRRTAPLLGNKPGALHLEESGSWKDDLGRRQKKSGPHSGMDYHSDNDGGFDDDYSPDISESRNNAKRTLDRSRANDRRFRDGRRRSRGKDRSISTTRRRKNDSHQKRSRSRSRSGSSRRNKSRSGHRNRDRSRGRSGSHGRNRDCSRSQSRHQSRDRSKNRSRSRNRVHHTQDRTRHRSRDRSQRHRKSRSRSRSQSRSHSARREKTHHSQIKEEKQETLSASESSISVDNKETSASLNLAIDSDKQANLMLAAAALYLMNSLQAEESAEANSSSESISVLDALTSAPSTSSFVNSSICNDIQAYRNSLCSSQGQGQTGIKKSNEEITSENVADLRRMLETMVGQDAVANFRITESQRQRILKLLPVMHDMENLAITQPGVVSADMLSHIMNFVCEILEVNPWASSL